jgi:hypothetical protein
MISYVNKWKVEVTHNMKKYKSTQTELEVGNTNHYARTLNLLLYILH